MSRPSSSMSRNLTLTEELEKLEQSITLTLQEIDHNFSRAHQIVTTSILPIVEQYAEHSKAVWEGSKFWKQFFEASANVSLSGYEEQAEGEEEPERPGAANEEAEDDETYGGDTTNLTSSQDHQHTTYLDSSTAPEGSDDDENDDDDDHPQHSSTLDSPSVINTTPRAKKTTRGQQNATFANYPSPYEALKQEYQPSAGPDESPSAPATPGAAPAPSMSSKQRQMIKPSQLPTATNTTTTHRRAAKDDVLLHRVLDKTYRIQATPHKTPLAQVFPRRAGAAGAAAGARYPPDEINYSSSPMSSPEMPLPPQLNPELFSPSTRRSIKYGAGAGSAPPRTPRAAAQPGQSILHTATKNKTRTTPGRQHQKWSSDDDNNNNGDDDDDDDEDEEWKLMSPPKTIQFAIPPNQLLQTPAREASKRIVQNLLNTAGGAANDTFSTTTTSSIRVPSHHHPINDDDDDDDDQDFLPEEGLLLAAQGTPRVFEGEPTSPMVIRGKPGGMIDDTF